VVCRLTIVDRHYEFAGRVLPTGQRIPVLR
jgi:hypothetical protein